MARTGKNNRTNALSIACILACICFAYGFSNQNALFQWKLPLAIVSATAAWAFLPRLMKGRATSESA